MCTARQIDQAADAVSEIVAAFRKPSVSLDPNNARLDLQQPGHTSDSQIVDIPGQAPKRRRRLFPGGFKLMSLLGFKAGSSAGSRREPEVLHDGTSAVELLATPRISWSDVHDDDEDDDDAGRALVIRKAMDLATSLERIEKNFVITDPRLPDNPIVSTDSPRILFRGSQPMKQCHVAFCFHPTYRFHLPSFMKKYTGEKNHMSHVLANYMAHPPLWD